MGNLNWNTPVGNTIYSHFQAGSTVAISVISGASGIGSFIAKPFSYWKNIDINRVALWTNTQSGSGIVTYLVGICTSLHPHGLYPSNASNIIGSGSSLNFSSVTVHTHQTNTTNFIPIALNSTYSLPLGSDIFIAAQTINRSGNPVVNFQGPDTNNYIGDTSNSVISSTTSVSTNENVSYLIPGYWSGSGSTEWYIDSTTIHTETNRNHANVPYYEFGCEFELNDFNTQSLNLEEFTWMGMEDYDGNTIYTCNVYDENTNIVGTALTEKAYGQTANLSVGYGYIFHFIPPIEIRPNYKYVVGIAGTGQTTTTGVHFTTNSNVGTLNDVFTQRQTYAFRTSRTSAFSSLGDTSANCRFLFGTSSTMRRGQGN